MFRLIKRQNVPQKEKVLIRTVGILGALLLMSIFILFMGHNPVKVYSAMIEGSFGTLYRTKEIIKLVIPLGLTALGIMIAFKMKFWNIGAEGQILIGATCASYIAYNFISLPKILMIPTMMLAGMLGGGLWALIPTIFKVRYNTNETLFTLMMNYIALKFVVYLQFGPWKDPKAFGFPKMPNFESVALLPKLFGVHIGWIVLAILTIAIYLFIHHTKMGYEIEVIGESKNTALYAGINVNQVFIRAIFMSGAIAGLVGMLQVSGIDGNLSYEMSRGYGFTAIIIAWLSNMNALFVPVVAFFFAILTQGASFIQSAFEIPQSAAEIIQAVVLLFALGSEFFINYRVVRNRREGA